MKKGIVALFALCFSAFFVSAIYEGMGPLFDKWSQRNKKDSFEQAVQKYEDTKFDEKDDLEFVKEKDEAIDDITEEGIKFVDELDDMDPKEASKEFDKKIMGLKKIQKQEERDLEKEKLEYEMTQENISEIKAVTKYVQGAKEGVESQEDLYRAALAHKRKKQEEEKKQREEIERIKKQQEEADERREQQKLADQKSIEQGKVRWKGGKIVPTGRRPRHHKRK